MKNHIRFFNFIYLSVFFYTILISCNYKSDDVNLTKAIELAGQNRVELEKVLAHYNIDKADSLKYKAAVFLIKYMPEKYGVSISDYDKYQDAFDTLKKINTQYENRPQSLDYFQFYKFYKANRISEIIKTNTDNEYNTQVIEKDINVITADYLIENIDYSFKAWNMPWAKHLNFRDFCEYILPYRYGHEQLQTWRKQYYDTYIKLLKPVANETDPVKVCSFLNQIGKQSFSEVGELGKISGGIKPLDLIKINSSTSCFDQSGLALLRMRGLGIPVTRLTTQCWGNWGSGHDFNGVLSLNNKWIAFQNEEEFGGPGIYHFPSNLRPAKLFAERYSKNDSSNYILKDPKSYKISLDYLDVTKDIINVSDVLIKLKTLQDESTACLCIFNNTQWMPIVKSEIHNGTALFKQLGRNIIYHPGIIKDSKVTLINKPFLLDESGRVKEIEPSKDFQNITLTKKYPLNAYQLGRLRGLNNCYMEGSNSPYFKNAVTLFKLNNINIPYPVEKNIKEGNFKYVRFVFPITDTLNESLAGIQLFDNNNELINGQPISSIPASKAFYESAFDNNSLTFIQIINGKYANFPQLSDNNLIIPDKHRFWIGLKLKNKIEIRKIVITPRTDDNYVLKDQPYVLYYWDNGWKMIEKKIASENKIQFNVPKNALYHLKNATKGVENRIFIYKNDKQLWY